MQPWPWTGVDLDAGELRIVRQLATAGVEPTSGPTDTGKPRTDALSIDVVELLRTHKRN